MKIAVRVLDALVLGLLVLMVVTLVIDRYNGELNESGINYGYLLTLGGLACLAVPWSLPVWFMSVHGWSIEVLSIGGALLNVVLGHVYYRYRRAG